MKVIVSSFGKEPFCHFKQDWSGNYKGITVDFVEYKWDKVSGISLVDEEQYSNWAAKAGWSIGLGIATGGIGLIAGALVSGNNKDRMIKFDLPNGDWIIGVVKRKQMRLCPKEVKVAMMGINLP